jgi:dTDP-4-amino-4,6-dideoxygalactose transaminase
MPPIPSSRTYFPEEDVGEVLRRVEAALREDGLRAGRYVAALESRVVAWCGAARGIAMNSATACLEAIFRALAVEGGEVVVPTNTFIATAAAAEHAGAAVRLIESRPDTLAPTEADVASAIGRRTRAVVLVHMGGIMTPETPAITRLCQRHGVPLVEDSAQALGVGLNGRPAGSFGVASCFSFYPTKVTAGGEGGVLTTSDPSIADVAASLRDQGHGEDPLTSVRLGFNWRMSELNAIVADTQVARLDEIVSGRARVAAGYRELLDGDQLLRPMAIPPGVTPNWYKFWVLVPDGVDRRAVWHGCAERHCVHLPSGIQDVPIHQQPPYRGGHRLPAADWFAAHHLCLPIYPDLPDEALPSVVDAVRAEVAAQCGAAGSRGLR